MNATHHDEYRPFEVDVSPQRDVVHVSPLGEVDLATAGRLRARLGDLRAAGGSQFVLDLHGVTFMDSTGIRLLVELARAARDERWELSVVRVPATVRRVLELSGVLEQIPFGDPGTV